MQRWLRMAAVTAGLSVVGRIFGTIAGTTLLLAWQALDGSMSISDGFEGPLFFGIVGLGAILGPLAAWTLMRHVPQWLAVGGTTLGTFASGGAALLLTGNPFFAMQVGMVGFIMSAAALNLRSTGDEPPRLEKLNPLVPRRTVLRLAADIDRDP